MYIYNIYVCIYIYIYIYIYKQKEQLTWSFQFHDDSAGIFHQIIRTLKITTPWYLLQNMTSC